MNHAGLRLVKDEIDKAVANPQCPQCRSTHVQDVSRLSGRGKLFRWKWCKDCLESWDYSLEGIDS